MPHFYKGILIIFQVLLPFFIISYRNQFNRPLITSIRFFIAIVAVWIYLLATRYLVDFIDIRLASTQADFDSIYNGDGARNAAALFFGWISGVILATLSWAVARSCHWFKHRKPRTVV